MSSAKLASLSELAGEELARRLHHASESWAEIKERNERDREI